MSERSKNGWQPMDTAPKDRCILLLSEFSDVYVCSWVQNFVTGQEAWMIARVDNGLDQAILFRGAPLCWHELPELPELPVQ